MSCTILMISSIRRQSTNLCRAFFIICQWACANPYALVRMTMIAPGAQRYGHCLETAARQDCGSHARDKQAACHSRASASCSQFEIPNLRENLPRAVRKGYHNSPKRLPPAQRAETELRYCRMKFWPMSESDQSRRFGDVCDMSALPPTTAMMQCCERLGLDVVELGRSNQCQHDRGVRAATVRTREQSGLRARATPRSSRSAEWRTNSECVRN